MEAVNDRKSETAPTHRQTPRVANAGLTLLTLETVGQSYCTIHFWIVQSKISLQQSNKVSPAIPQNRTNNLYSEMVRIAH